MKQTPFAPFQKSMVPNVPASVNEEPWMCLNRRSQPHRRRLPAPGAWPPQRQAELSFLPRTGYFSETLRTRSGVEVCPPTMTTPLFAPGGDVMSLL